MLEGVLWLPDEVGTLFKKKYYSYKDNRREMRPILEETIQLQSHISERNHEHSHFQGQLRNCHLPAPIPCPRIATKSLLCRNVTLNSTSSHHLFDSIFTQE